ncbi:MAG: hypothetical protein ACREI8_13165 [Myxococcota bacterium]
MSFPLFYRVTLRLSRDRSLSLLASALLLASIQYLLLMRQCRYYALLPVLFFLALWGYDALPSKRGVTLLSLGLVGLFHSNPVSCAIVATGFVLHAALFRRRDRVGIHLLVSGLFLAAASVPWVLATGLLDRTSAALTFAPSRSAFGINLLGTLIMSNRYICPWLVLAGLGIAWSLRRFRLRPIDALCLCMLAPAFVFLPQFLLSRAMSQISISSRHGSWCSTATRPRPTNTASTAPHARGPRDERWFTVGAARGRRDRTGLVLLP